jgi:hypothetical protein
MFATFIAKKRGMHGNPPSTVCRDWRDEQGASHQPRTKESDHPVAGILVCVVGPHQERVIDPRQTENADEAVELLNDVARHGIAPLATVKLSCLSTASLGITTSGSSSNGSLKALGCVNRMEPWRIRFSPAMSTYL